jgi:hypothetical protein
MPKWHSFTLDQNWTVRPDRGGARMKLRPTKPVIPDERSEDKTAPDPIRGNPGNSKNNWIPGQARNDASGTFYEGINLES